MSQTIINVRQFRTMYSKIKQALPWLDMSYWDTDTPAFPKYAKSYDIPFIKSIPLKAEMQGQLKSIRQKEGIGIFRFCPSNLTIQNGLDRLIPELAEQKIPLVVLHTEVSWAEIKALAERNPSLPIIIESGNRKILYFFKEISDLLQSYSNLYLCTYNFCNWLGIERLCNQGLSQRLLFGTHRPQFNPDVVMGPIVMSRLSWNEKCDIAGNNLSRLIELPMFYPPEVPFDPPEPFIIDTHIHTLSPGEISPTPFPTPDERFKLKDWLEFINLCALDKVFNAPMESLFDDSKTGRSAAEIFVHSAPKCFYYYEIFNPNYFEKQVSQLNISLADPACLGFKIHPSLHQIEADSDRYREAYIMANRTNKVILTHSWDISEYNPSQHLSFPERFRKHLTEFPATHFILGHAGGRPGALESVIKLCRDFPNVKVDLAGDYFDEGLIECLVDRIGPEKILFASDMDWIDPRCNLGAVLAASICDKWADNILCQNAKNLFNIDKSTTKEE